MQNIFLCGDPHGRFDHLLTAVKAHQPAAVILLGDIQATASLDVVLADILDLTDIWWIHGNHDTDSEADYDHLFGSCLAERNLHGRVVEVAGIRIAGLGGVFRRQIWMPPAPPNYVSEADFLARCGRGNRWREGLPRKHRSSIFPDQIEQLRRQQADILVTHEAPSCHPHGFIAVDELAQALGVRAVFHGHHHEQRDYVGDRERLGFRAYGVGLRGIIDGNGMAISDTQ